jgi:hypothetical protein
MLFIFSSGVDPLRLYLSPMYQKTAFVWQMHLSPSTKYLPVRQGVRRESKKQSNSPSESEERADEIWGAYGKFASGFMARISGLRPLNHESMSEYCASLYSACR